ncbi:MAG: hypothetical protein AABY91_08290 [Gemmatimonadota bacterium]
MRLVTSRLATVAALLGAGYLGVAGLDYQPLQAQGGSPPSCPDWVGVTWFPDAIHSNIRFKFPQSHSGAMIWQKTQELPALYDWGNSEMVRKAYYVPNSEQLQSGTFDSPAPPYYFIWHSPQMEVACRDGGILAGFKYRVLSTAGEVGKIYEDGCDDPEMGGCGAGDGGGATLGEYGDSRGGMSGEDPPDWKCDIYYEYEILPNGELVVRYWRVLQCYPSY